MLTLYIILGVLALVIISLIAIYNRLVTGRNRIEEAWSDIDVQLKRRHDLIPNILETVKGYAAHEKTVFEDVTRARTQAMGAQSADQRASAENMLSNTLKTLFAVAENYPDLKANANFLDLQRELADTENKIQSARRFYNGNVRDYNIMMESFPSNLVAGSFGFMKKEFFGMENEAEREVPKVSFPS